MKKKSKNQFNIIVCGIGGQGVLKIADIIGRAVSKNQKVLQNNFYGLSQTKGSVSSHIRLGNSIESPIIFEKECDLIIGLDMFEIYKNIRYCSENTKIIVSDSYSLPNSIKLGLSKEGYSDNFMSKYNVTTIKFKESEKLINYYMLGVSLNYIKNKCGINTYDVTENIKNSEVINQIKEGGLHEF